MRLKKTKALRYVVATFLTMGTVLSVGFLSFSGLWIIYPYIIPAVLAFFLSGVIEGKVFGTSIFKGLARLKLLTPNAKKHLLFSELNKFLDIKSFKEKCECDFLSDYSNQRKKYKALKNNPSAKEEDIEEAKKRLEELKEYFYQQIKIQKVPNNQNPYISQALRKASSVELNSAKRSVWFLRFFWIISILVGVVSGFVTAFAVQEAITVGLALSLSVTALSAIVWPVALFAAIGATFLLYYAITDIVKNDAISKACSKTLELFKRKNGESISAYIFRLLALSVVVAGITSLTIFATLASGGTCWIVMQKGIKLLAPKLPIFVAYCASAVLIPINFATDLIYGFSTTIQTIDNCKDIFTAIFKSIKHPIEAIKNFCFSIETKLDKLKENESWGQFFNPFRILAKLIISPLQSLVFIGHLISIGLTTDRFLNVPPPLVAGVCAASEGLQDLSFLTTEDNHAHEDDDGHDHGNLLQLPLQALLSPILLPVGILYWFFKKFGNGIGFFDAIAQTFKLPLLNIVFFPLLLPSTIWHWVFKKSDSNLTFFESIKQNFEVHTHDHYHEHEHEEESIAFELSEEWREKQRVDWFLDTAVKRLKGVWIGEDNAAEKQNMLKFLASHREEIIEYLKEKRRENPNISLEAALKMFLDQENTSKQKPKNGMGECLSNKSQVANGHCNRSINGQEQSFDFSIFKIPRGSYSNKNKPTTTELYVESALSLVTPAYVK